MTSSHQRGPARTSRLRHYGGFLLAGTAAFVADAGVLSALTDGLGLWPVTARLFSIMVAMVVSWQINRRLTFAVQAPSSLREFSRFAAVSWTAQVVNYGTYVAMLAWQPDLWPVWAVAVSSLVAMIVSYTGFRFGVFAQRS